ncbi:MAG TPA: hypothetical protein VKY73_00700 [Polyangiaceae bacterium]|nr:hypothetical protein [Polyangiaceae bacterium]
MELPLASSQAESPCPRCSAEGLLIPSAYYLEGDRAQFEAAEAAIHEADLNRLQVTDLLAQLEQLAGQPQIHKGELAGVLSRFPRLSGLEPLLPSGSTELRRFLGMMFTVLTPLSSASGFGSGSGLRPSVVKAGPGLALEESRKLG